MNQGKKCMRSSFARNVAEFLFYFALVVLIRTIGFGLYQVPTGSMETTMLVGERFFADKLTPLFKSVKRGEIISFNDPYYQYSKNPMMQFVEEYIWGPSNWTKRVIGIPGDHVQGKIEDGKPVIYINGEKLDEPYLNKYPLIEVFDDEPAKVVARAQRDVMSMMSKDHAKVNDFENYFARAFENHVFHRSYDPSVSFANQPFYVINERFVQRDANGNLPLIMPRTPIKTKPQMHNGNLWGNGSDEFDIKLGKNQYWLMGDNRQGSKDARTWGPLDGKHIHGRILFRIWSIDSQSWLWLFDLIAHPIDFWKHVRWNRFFQPVH